ncbi:MAG TPA: ABC transporter permease [Agrobacterium sp.]|uniref:ABC transporter permease n=1 Tax=Rhizobium TaxID=379 RepID=UPI000E80B9E3|nr:ABC transporter permease [Agrobacterium sp.]
MNNKLTGTSAIVLYAITAAMMVFILAPIILVVAISFSDSYFVTFPPQGFTFRWYAAVLQNEEFTAGLTFSAALAVATTILSLALGVPAAFALSRGKFIGRSVMKGLLLSPLIFPVLVTGLALLQLFSGYGWMDTKLKLLIAHTVVTSPYVIRTVLTSLQLVNVSLEEAARTLGATRWKTFTRVIFPQIAPGVASGSIFCFMVSFDNYPVSMWLADSANLPVPIVLYRQIGTVFDPSVATMSTIIIALAVTVVLVLDRLVGLRRAMAM